MLVSWIWSWIWMGRRIQSHCWLGGHHGLCGDGELILSGYGTPMCMDFTWDSVWCLRIQYHFWLSGYRQAEFGTEFEWSWTVVWIARPPLHAIWNARKLKFDWFRHFWSAYITMRKWEDVDPVRVWFDWHEGPCTRGPTTLMGTWWEDACVYRLNSIRVATLNSWMRWIHMYCFHLCYVVLQFGAQ